MNDRRFQVLIRRLRCRPSPCLVATLAGVMLWGCAQLEPEPEVAEPAPAPSVMPHPAPPPARTAVPSASAPASPPAPTPTPAVSSAPPAAPPSPEGVATSSQERGSISMYGRKFEGRKTASGERFDPDALTMAHPTLPFGTRVRVTNLENQRSVEVVVNDRGPFVSGRIADLSEAAARRIGMIADGVVEALLEVIQPAKSP